MQIEEYALEKTHIAKYTELLQEFYGNDKRIDMHIKYIQKQLSASNPFFNFGEIRNFLASRDGKTVGHCSAIFDSRNPGVGLIGFFDCANDQTVCTGMLQSCIAWLKKRNYSVIRGPVNFSIWHNYRFITSNKRDPELFDPFNKEYYPALWEKNGFRPTAHYVSAVRTKFEFVIQPTEQAANTLLNNGFRIRDFDTTKASQELRVILKLANDIFSKSWNFVPLSIEEFEYLYEDILPAVDPSFFEIIEDQDSKPVGFCFSIINPFNKNQIIMKTVGVLNDYQRQGVGAALLHSQHTRAGERGFSEFYYPLIRVGNNVTKLPYEEYEIITEYSTYELDQ